MPIVLLIHPPFKPDCSLTSPTFYKATRSHRNAFATAICVRISFGSGTTHGKPYFEIARDVLACTSSGVVLIKSASDV